MIDSITKLKIVSNPAEYMHEESAKYGRIFGCYLIIVAKKENTLKKHEIDKWCQAFAEKVKENLTEEQYLVILSPGLLFLIEKDQNKEKKTIDIWKKVTANCDEFIADVTKSGAICTVITHRYEDNMTLEYIQGIFQAMSVAITKATNKTKIETWRISDEDKEAILKSAKEIAKITGEPSFVDKVGHYAKALLKWHKAGYPVRSDTEVAEIVKICQSCERFNHDKQVCGVCGCKVTLKGHAVRSKARLSTERCPLNKW